MPLIGSVRPLHITIIWNEVTGKIECQIDRAVPFPALVGVFCTVQMQLAQSVLVGVAGGSVGGPAPGPALVTPTGDDAAKEGNSAAKTEN